MAAIEYTALTLRCTACERQWRAVYQVLGVTLGDDGSQRHFRDDVGEVDPYRAETCRSCGGEAHALRPAWVIPTPRSGEAESAQP